MYVSSGADLSTVSLRRDEVDERRGSRGERPGGKSPEGGGGRWGLLFNVTRAALDCKSFETI